MIRVLPEQADNPAWAFRRAVLRAVLQPKPLPIIDPPLASEAEIGPIQKVSDRLVATGRGSGNVRAKGASGFGIWEIECHSTPQDPLPGPWLAHSPLRGRISRCASLHHPSAPFLDDPGNWLACAPSSHHGQGMRPGKTHAAEFVSVIPRALRFHRASSGASSSARPAALSSQPPDSPGVATVFRPFFGQGAPFRRQRPAALPISAGGPRPEGS
jgi:hypothetical protein